mmetsp:Transcript_51156/g.111152  ORF Transcript_51156/g.111152 Transcript_51156/m.111152 type:complete len:506 (-) Transcript_51156:378-1895(-)
MKECVNDALVCTEQALHFLNSLSSMLKLEAGKVVANPTAVDISDIFEAATAIIRPQLNSGVTLIVNAPKNLGDVLIDATVLTHVIVNLAQNAVRFTQEGTIEIRCDMCYDMTATFSVSDTGTGMTKEMVATVFERYKSMSRGGVGIGLHISYKLVKVLGSELQVESPWGNGQRGTRFFFTLQLQPAFREGSSRMSVDGMGGYRIQTTSFLAVNGARSSRHETSLAEPHSSLTCTDTTCTSSNQTGLRDSDEPLRTPLGLESAGQPSSSPSARPPAHGEKRTNGLSASSRCLDRSMDAQTPIPCQTPRTEAAVRADAQMPMPIDVPTVGPPHAKTDDQQAASASLVSFAPAVAHQTLSAAQAAPAFAALPKGLRVLVADDMRMNRKLMHRVLEREMKAEWVVETAETAEEAMERVLSAEPRFGLVIFDENFGADRMSGSQAIRLIREAGVTNLVIISCTGALGGSTSEEEILASGADAVWGKPFPSWSDGTMQGELAGLLHDRRRV